MGPLNNRLEGRNHFWTGRGPADSPGPGFQFANDRIPRTHGRPGWRELRAHRLQQGTYSRDCESTPGRSAPYQRVPPPRSAAQIRTAPAASICGARDRTRCGPQFLDASQSSDRHFRHSRFAGRRLPRLVQDERGKRGSSLTVADEADR